MRLEWTAHRRVGLLYAITALGFLLVGFLLMLLMRWQLAYPGQPLSPWLAPWLGENNAPGGIMLPEFYNQLVAMHGTVMVFLAVVPLLAGGFGVLLVPPLIGAPGIMLPRLSLLAYGLYLAGGLLMLASFFVEGGANNSGWTAYAPLAVLATPGQNYWLVGILLIGTSSILGAIAMIVTIVQARQPGLALWRMPFFVWSQLVTALLLLLAFPALQAAAIFQLMDRLAGTSFFMPSGLVVGGIPLQGLSGGGNPLLWQHLFWFLAHPEVYVLVLPAMGIVAEVITTNTRRPLWGYGLMVSSVLFIGLMSMVVWAHHMFLSGMGTTLSTFFQVTTMIISIPSVVLISALVLSLWGGSIRFPTAMLFALAFLPMFGLGGLTGLPLGLAASDISLHDTYYVVAHFHYLVAPGTVFAIFAGIYHWYPRVTGRRLGERLGKLHFWGSFLLMNSIFLPMFIVGLAGVNRRLYDAGLQYALAQPLLSLQRHMTWSAIALGLMQLPFLLNLVLTARQPRQTPDDANPADHSAETAIKGPGPINSFVPGDSAYVVRKDTGTSGSRLAVWLVVATGTMFFGSLFSGYVLIRTSFTSWPSHADFTRTPGVAVQTMLLAGAVLLIRSSRRSLAAAAAAVLVFLVVGAAHLRTALAAGLAPATDLALASWFTLSGLHLALAGGVAAVLLQLALVAPAAPPQRGGWLLRIGNVRLMLLFTGLVWIALVASF